MDKQLRNKRGGTFLLVLMLSVTFFILGLALAPPLTQLVNEKLIEQSCTTATDSFIRGGCLLMDLITPAFVGVVFGVAGALIGAKVL
jgi:hypothetical protein